MSQRDMWKMIHLVHRYGRPGLTAQALHDAGVDCYSDTVQPLLNSGVFQPGPAGEFELSPPALRMLEACLLANRRHPGPDLTVDEPRVFVVMPFSQPWSNDVYAQLIEPAVTGAGLQCVRGDTLVRIGDLTSNIWGELLEAGIVVAEVSVPNVNVYYELGLVHALGKDALLLKQKGATLPADFGGAHYYEYDPADLAAGRAMLQNELTDWAYEYRAPQVKALGG
jgi:hypothetical protein